MWLKDLGRAITAHPVAVSARGGNLYVAGGYQGEREWTLVLDTEGWFPGLPN
jgi:hypothetical protein